MLYANFSHCTMAIIMSTYKIELTGFADYIRSAAAVGDMTFH